jgi:phosphatidylglycerophosphate synthase
MSMLVVPAKLTEVTTKSALSAAAFVMTWVRVPIGFFILISLLTRSNLLGMAMLVLFVILDVADGIVARAGRADNSSRRGLDSLIDRSTVVIFFVEAAMQSNVLRPAALIIALINVASLPFAIITWHRYRVVLKAPEWHRLWSAGLFMTGLLYFAGRVEIAAVTGTLGALAMLACSLEMISMHITLGRVWGMPGSD